MPVVVCLEERGAGGELVHDAADAPHVAGVGPAQLQDDLGRAVVPGRHDLRKNIWSCTENIYTTFHSPDCGAPRRKWPSRSL